MQFTRILRDNYIKLKNIWNISEVTHFSREVAQSSTKKEEKVHDFRGTVYTVTGRRYVLQLNMYMIHVYIIIHVEGMNVTWNGSHANAYSHAHLYKQFFFDVDGTKVFGSDVA